MTFLADARLPAETWERYGRVSPTGGTPTHGGPASCAAPRSGTAGSPPPRAELEARYAEDPPPWLPSAWQRIDALRAFVADLDARLQSRHERGELAGAPRVAAQLC